MSDKAKQYAKGIAAVVTAMAASVANAAAGASAKEVAVTAILAGAGALAVIIVPNKPKE